MIRKFELYGLNTGELIDLTDYGKFTLTLPTGLGFKFTNTYIQVGSRRIKTNQKQEFSSLTGIIEINGETRNAWEVNYNELKNFIMKNKENGFLLYYSCIDNGYRRYIVCDFNIVEKTEKLRYCLPIPITVEPRTNWLANESVITNVSAKEEAGSIYAFKKNENFNDEWEYSYCFEEEEETETYNYKYLSEISGRAILYNVGDANIPLKITIFGDCIDPELILLNNADQIIQRMKINYEIPEDSRVEISSEPENAMVVLITDTNDIIDLKPYLSIDDTYSSFIELPIGTYTLDIKEKNNNFVDAIIEMRLEYIGG